MGRIDDIQTALKPLKKRKKCKYISMIILGLAESFKSMNQAGPTQSSLARLDHNAI